MMDESETGEDGNVRNVGQILSRVWGKGDLESGSREKEMGHIEGLNNNGTLSGG